MNQKNKIMSKGRQLFLTLLIPVLVKTQVNYVSNNIFQTDYFIENRGQFNYQQIGKHKILYSTEMPYGNVFFHKNGFSIHQKKVKPRKIHEQPEYNFAMAEQMEKTIQLEWIGANQNCELIQEQKSNHYFSFGPEEFKSYGYKKLTYRNIYPNIDIVYTIEDNIRFHYSILLHKGAKVSDLKMKYHNVDVSLLEGETGLELQKTVFPVYEFGLKCNKLIQEKHFLPCVYTLSETEIGFIVQGVDVVNEELEIDPWVAGTTTLTGDGNGNQRGYDVDYDSDGNLFVYGGGVNLYNSSAPTKIAKYSTKGQLLWTFNCIMSLFSWNTGSYKGISNFIVDKNTNKIYTGEAFNSSGTKTIRLKNDGVYDNFISNVVPGFLECWEFQFNCNNGDIIVMGGSTSSYLTMGTVDKTNGNTNTSCVTTYTTFQQDVVGSAIDNKGELYVLLSSYAGSRTATPEVHNKIFKCNSTLNGNVWSRWSGYDDFKEADNKLDSGSNISNGFNCLSANASYLFYYDGIHLKAFNLLTGDTAGYPILIASHISKVQGGIESDDCNNVYIGGNNGNVLVYNFDGTNFNYTRQIYFNGFNGRPVHDLKASKKSNRLYISGHGFAAETSFSSCDSSIVAATVVSDCISKAIVSISNTISGSVFDFIWRKKSTQEIVRSKLNTSQLSDTFTGTQGEEYQVSIVRISVCLPASVTENITFKPYPTVHFDTVVKCQGQTYSLGKSVYNTAGTYKDTIVENGCLKIVQTTLSFLTASLDTIKRSLCYGDTIYIRGKAVSQSGIYYDSLINRFGCDSVLMFDIKVLAATPSTTSLYDTICLGESRVFNNQTLTSSGTYVAKYTNVLGCDSTVTFYLTVITPVIISRNISICSGDTFKIDTFKFTKTGKYNISYKSGKNCDSTIEVNLIVNPSYFFSSKASTCLGKSVTFFGQNYSISGLYYKTFQTSNGCDSIYEMDLHIYRIIGAENYEFCQGDSLKILNRYVKTSGDYYDTFKLPSGCDSFHLTKVKVNSWPVTQIDTIICVDDSFEYKNKVYRLPTIISDTIFSNYKTTCHTLKFIYLDFKNCDTLNECNRILIPTGFSPNNDGVNDKLSLIVKSDKINIVDFILFNRWGELIYNYFDDKEGWKGYYKGDEAPVGVYNYKLKYKCKDQLYNKSGNVTLIR